MEPEEGVKPEKAGLHMISAARRMYQTEEIEIDDNADLSAAENEEGAWVSAWVWVPYDEVKPEDFPPPDSRDTADEAGLQDYD